MISCVCLLVCAVAAGKSWTGFMHKVRARLDVNGSHNRILYSVVHDIGKAGDSVDTVGIMAGNPAPNPARNNLIHGNKVFRCATHGILFWAVSESCVISENTCEHNAGYGIFLEKLGPQGRCVNHVVSQDKVRANGAYGIIIEATENCMVLGNKSYENGKDGIAVDSTNGPAQFNAVVGNRCAENMGTGVRIGKGSLSTCVEGNRKTRNARARSAHP